MNDYDPNYVHVPTYFLLGVKTIVINQDNKILLLQRSDKCSNLHTWDFGGGGVDKSENPINSAIREAKEETGLTIYNVKPLTTYIDTSGADEAVIIGFTANTGSSDVQLSWEHEAFQWLTLEELQTIELSGVHAAIRDAYNNHTRNA